MSSSSEGKYEQVFPWHCSLPSLPRSFQSPCALQHTVVHCCAFYVFAHVVLAKGNHSNEKIMSAIP